MYDIIFTYIYIYIYTDLSASSSSSNLTIVTSLSSATHPKAIKIATASKHLPHINSETYNKNAEPKNAKEEVEWLNLLRSGKKYQE